MGDLTVNTFHLSPLIFIQVSPPPASIQPNKSRDTLDLEILQEQVKRREAKIIELEREAALLKDQKTILELDVSH